MISKMIIRTAKFIQSNTDVEHCPSPDIPEYAFIGRSNVGKSSLINILTGIKNLAKTSSLPGKTQLINHFIINNQWYLVDLPGYGYAKNSKSNRKIWEEMISGFLLKRTNLMNTFVLIDSRIEPQKIDLEFMGWMAENEVPFSMVFTKTDKLTKSELASNLEKYRNIMHEQWEELPLFFQVSSKTGEGKDELINYISEINPFFVNQENSISN